MKEEQNQFLKLWGQSPARLTVEQVAWALNCQPHDIPILVTARLLKPLGSPRLNSVKFFAAMEISEQAKDRVWLSKVTGALCEHWQKKNSKKTRASIPMLPLLG